MKIPLVLLQIEKSLSFPHEFGIDHGINVLCDPCYVSAIFVGEHTHKCKGSSFTPTMLMQPNGQTDSSIYEDLSYVLPIENNYNE